MQQLWLWIAAWIIEATERNSTTFFRSLKALCSCFSRRVRDIDSRRCATRARINARNDSRRARRPRSLLHLPFVFPLNYLRVLRDWPTNPVRLNNLPIIRGPLCFIRRVSNKSHCVFRRAASNSIRVRTRTLSAYPGAGKRRREETEEEATGEIAKRGGDRARFARIDSKFGWTSRIYDEATRSSANIPILCAVRDHEYC